MAKSINQLCNNMFNTLHNALPVLLVAIFYQITILQLPMEEVMNLLGWMALLLIGMTLAL